MVCVGASLGDGTCVEFCIDVTDRKRTEAALRKSQEQLAAELAAMTRLHDLVARLLVSPDLDTALEEVLAATIDIIGTEMGTVHLWDAERNVLSLVALHGFADGIVNPFTDLTCDAGTPCEESAKTGRRVIVEDIQANPLYEPFRGIATKAGYRAVQSTPLVSRSGEVLGVLSTHYSQPHQPSDRDLRILDLYARQAADFIEHVRNREEAEAANVRKDEFLATLAHELRNPLAPISTGIELLKLADDRSAALEEVLPTMERQTRQLVALVDDLLDVSRITRGKLDLKRRRVTLADVIESATEEAMPLIDTLGHKLAVTTPSQPVRIVADPHRLAQVISNLLNNAAKYTPRGGQIELSAISRDSELVLTVSDSGIGIPHDKLESIFEMFAQVESFQPEGGLGIGLTLVKSIVEMHGGRIDVQSEGAGRGATFTIQLPVVVDATSESPDEDSEPSTDASGLRILVVDDSKPAANLLSAVVKVLGNEVRTAYDGKEATRIAAEFLPDVIIMDVGMPEMDGCEAARYIRNQSWGNEVTMIALTGWGQDADRQRTGDAGFDFHLVKPPAPGELRRLLVKARSERLRPPAGG
jgi:signal transduction histidine kinase/ActR/RegA family two-component response regulator